MRDPFEKAAGRIVKRIGKECIFIRFSNGERIKTTAVLDEDLEVFDEVGNVINREDMVSLLNDEVGVPKTRDKVEFSDSGRVYKLGRTVRDDGFVAKMLATRSG